ncbi:hypothetical protein INT43_007996 [Umbelopsis isabellina]|uniref:TLC domain-containing protein n=1 Tax=Mortierella isabellina TaxID=91625 RepID=A0A8H7UFE5_MORIS|nr:hypothetical protein INT43_007996 [Umbelopsis isabellina]
MGNTSSREVKAESKGDGRKRKALSTAVNKVTNNFTASPTTTPLHISRPTPIGHRVVLHDQATPLSSLTGFGIGMPGITIQSPGINQSRGSSLLSDDLSQLSSPISNSPRSLSRSFGSETGGLIFGEEMGYSLLEGKKPSNRLMPRPASPINVQTGSGKPNIYNYQDDRESDRQQRQHYLFKRVFNGNYAVPLEKPTAILDCGCGAGVWAQEMCIKFPNATVIGLDLTPPRKHSRGIREEGLMYVGRDITKDLGFLEGTFDFIYQRDMGTVVPSWRWAGLLVEFASIMKPGGWIQLVECDLPYKCPGPVLSLVNEWYDAVSGALDINVHYAAGIKDKLRDACFQDIQEQTYDIPIGEWPDDPKQKEFGFLYREQQKALFKSMKKWWLDEIHVTSEDYDQVSQEALEEFEEYHSFTRWRVFTARKPLHVILASTLGCSIIFEVSRVVSRQLFPKTFKRFRGFNELNWNIHVVSLVHCITTVIGAFINLYSGELSDDRVFGYSARLMNINSLSCGYFLWDMVTGIRYIKYQGIGMAFHGVASFLVFILAYRPFFNYYGAVFMMYELSTPFLNFNWFMDKLGWTGSRIQLLNGIVLLCTFFGARILRFIKHETEFPYFVSLFCYKYFTTRTIAKYIEPLTDMVAYGSANIILNCLNVYWFGLMIRMVISRFSGKPLPAQPVTQSVTQPLAQPLAQKAE